MKRFLFVLLLGMFASLALASVPLVGADGADSADETEAVEEAVAGLGSPRETLRTFLSAMNDIKRGDAARIEDALTALDLSEINPLVRKERGEHLAWQLLEVLDRTRVIDLEAVPVSPGQTSWDFHRYPQGVLRIRHLGDGNWRFDSASMRQLPAIYEGLQGTERLAGLSDNTAHLPWDIRIRRMLPPALTDQIFLIENWRWLALFLVVALGVLVDWLVSRVLRRAMVAWLKRRPGDYHAVEDKEGRLRPLGIMAMALVWWTGIHMVGLPETGLLVLLVAVKALASFSAVWAAYRLVDLLAAWLTASAERTDNKLDDVLVPLVPRTLKIFVTVVGILFIADNLNIDVTGLLAGLGLGGLAFALAAKDAVQNLFGSITVLLDRTFTVGDWIVVDGQEGTVERMGFRSTRVRTFYNSQITIPNAKFITAVVDNMGERRYRRYKAHFGLTYDTPPDRVEAFCEGLRELVRQHPYMRKDYFHVYLNQLGGSSLDVLVYVFWETPDWSTELRERHRFLLDSLRLAEQLGVEFAFPTQTLYLREEETPSNQAGDPAEAFSLGRDAAQRVVRETLAEGERPPPVSFK